MVRRLDGYIVGSLVAITNGNSLIYVKGQSNKQNRLISQQCLHKRPKLSWKKSYVPIL